MVEAKLLRKKLKEGLIVDKWDLVTIIEKQQTEIEALKAEKEKLFMGMLDMALDAEIKEGKK
jgi:asparagine synthetase A